MGVEWVLNGVLLSCWHTAPATRPVVDPGGGGGGGGGGQYWVMEVGMIEGPGGGGGQLGSV